MLISVLVYLTVYAHMASARHRNHGHHDKSKDSDLEPSSQFDGLNGGQDELENLVLLHSERVAEAGSCEVPQLQVVHVSDHYPGRYFLPHCTMLHRCGKHAGCCGTDRLRCVADKKEKVSLYFYSVKLGDSEEMQERKIEKLDFMNHTKCACQPVESYRTDL